MNVISSIPFVSSIVPKEVSSGGATTNNRFLVVHALFFRTFAHLSGIVQ